MVNLKTKSSKFISLSGEMEPGGAPIFADDIIRVQENDQADILNFFESSRRLLPELLTWNGAALSKQFENGLILSGLEYDNTDPANPVVSEGYILSGGEVCYYPGGVIATGLINRGLLYLFKGASVNTARTFNVGGSKDILVTHNITVEVGEVTGNGLELQAGTAITATDEVVVLGIGIAGDFLGEEYFTTRAANKINEIGKELAHGPWTSITSSYPFGSDLGYCVSRLRTDGTTEIRGSLSIDTTLLSAGVEIIGSFGAGASNFTANTIPSTSQHTTTLNHSTLRAIFTFGGTIRLLEPAGTWSVYNNDTLELVFNEIVNGTKLAPLEYTYDKDFLNIT